jgi:hypothetical protein
LQFEEVEGEKFEAIWFAALLNMSKSPDVRLGCGQTAQHYFTVK